MNCHCCQSDEVKKSGRFTNKNFTVQRYQCNRCGKTFSDKQPLDGLRVDFKQACQVVNLLCESMGIRAIQRITGLHQETILNILETAGQKAAQFLDAKIRNITAERIAADEIQSHVFCKQRNIEEGADDSEIGDQFTFFAIDPVSKLIVTSFVGKRTAINANEFLTDLKNRMAGTFQLTTDNWKIYSGFNGQVARVFGDDVHHAVESKYFAKPSPFMPRRLISIRRQSRIGNPDMKLATTAHAERTNLSARLFNRRFTRCTLGYSKKLDNLKYAVALFCWHFNFCRKHSAHKQTPAQAAKLADHQWTIEEMLATVA